MIRRVKIARLRERAKRMPDGYLEECLSVGVMEGVEVLFDDEAWERLAKKYSPTPLPPPPGTTRGMLTNFTAATARWVKAGFTRVSKMEFEERIAICRACPFWQENARFGLGKCAKCGCTRLKHWMATETCPEGRWPKISENSPAMPG